MVGTRFASVDVTRDELELLQNCLWYWLSSPAGPKGQAKLDCDQLRRRLLRLELESAGWKPTQDLLPDLPPQSP